MKLTVGIWLLAAAAAPALPESAPKPIPHPRVLIAEADAVRIPKLQEAAPSATFLIVRPNAVPPTNADAALGVCNEAILKTSPRLRWVQVMATGADACLSVPGVRERALSITAMQGTATAATADHVLAFILMHARAMPRFAERQQQRQWNRDSQATAGLQALEGKTLLVVGLGKIGTAVAERAHAFGMTVVGIRSAPGEGPSFVSHVGGPAELKELAPQADYIVNALPLTEDTRGIFNAGFFGVVKRGAFFVNIGRGESVVTDDLVAALRDGRLGGAGVDVVTPSPLPSDHPLWSLPGVIISPAIAGYSDDLWDRRWSLVGENLRRFVQGQPLMQVIDQQRGY